MASYLDRKTSRTLGLLFGIGMCLVTIGLVFWKVNYKLRSAGISLFAVGIFCLLVDIIYYVCVAMTANRVPTDRQIVITQVKDNKIFDLLIIGKSKFFRVQQSLA